MSLFRQLFRQLLHGPRAVPSPGPDSGALAHLAERLDQQARVKLGRSLSIRAVDAGSCNACELEIHAVCGPTYDLERFGIHFVASPRHADILLVTGPLCANMSEALRRTYNATPDPKWVVAMGDCAADGGLFAGGYAVQGGIGEAVPVDLVIPGCPPTPEALLSGLLALLETAGGAAAGKASRS
ncbi:MAG: NADH-quinone oxidoreductase subunit NuoB [Rhodospirillaceae bacterium]|nr:NADH-quinone oxidoreductase subunit NuoB [Rhodospirillaceae bacterium]